MTDDSGAAPGDDASFMTFGRRRSAGQAYLVRPGEDGEGTGPGVLVLSSWWGLTRGIKDFCNRLCDEGFVVLAPDLMGGALPETAAEAELELGETDPNTTANLVLSSAVALRSATDEPAGPVAVIGFSMGASWALWAATRQPESFHKVVVYYGSQTIDFADMAASVQGHFAEHDDLVSADERRRLAGEVARWHAGFHRFDEAIEVDARGDAHTVEHVHEVFRGDVSGGARSIGATADTSHRAIEVANPELEANHEVR